MQILRYLKEMSMSRRDVIANIQSKFETRVEHLLKLFFYRHSPAFNHWCHELSNISRVPRLKPSNKLPSSELIYEHLWKNRQDGMGRESVKSQALSIEAVEGPLDLEYSYTNLFNFLTEFMQWQADMMSQFDHTDDYKIRDKVTELLDLYRVR